MNLLIFIVAAIVTELLCKTLLKRSGKMEAMRAKFEGKKLAFLFLMIAALLLIQGLNILFYNFGMSATISSLIGGIVLGPFLALTLAFI